MISISRPINKDLLIHTITYTGKGSDDDLGWGEDPAEPITVENVRIEPKEMVVADNLGNSIQSNTTLFWDDTYSTPCDFEYDANVKWNNNSYLVKQVDEFYDNKKLHHKEVRLL